jgi:hypothetical protein
MSALLAMLRAHHAQSGFEWPFDPVLLSISLATAIASDNQVVLISPSGMLWGAHQDSPLGAGRVAVEIVLWASRGESAPLIARFEDWAHTQGCTQASICCLHRPSGSSPEVFARLYRRSGYRPAETVFAKRI